MGSDGGNEFVSAHAARVFPQPGDGSCLYHSLRVGLSGAGLVVGSTEQVRRLLAGRLGV
jgi:hypothetical protein